MKGSCSVILLFALTVFVAATAIFPERTYTVYQADAVIDSLSLSSRFNRGEYGHKSHEECLGRSAEDFLKAGRAALEFFKTQYGADFSNLTDDQLTGLTLNVQADDFTLSSFVFNPIEGDYLLLSETNGHLSQSYGQRVRVSLAAWRITANKNFVSKGQNKVALEQGQQINFGEYCMDAKSKKIIIDMDQYVPSSITPNGQVAVQLNIRGREIITGCNGKQVDTGKGQFIGLFPISPLGESSNKKIEGNGLFTLNKSA